VTVINCEFVKAVPRGMKVISTIHGPLNKATRAPQIIY